MFIFCTAIATIWWLWARTMKSPPVVALREYVIGDHVDLDTLRARLAALPGVREASIEAERRMAYVRVNLEHWDEDGVRRLLDAPATS